MSAGQPGDILFFCKTAYCAGDFHHAVSLLCCFFRNLAFAEGMQFGIQPFIASTTADRPMLILIVLDLA